MTQELMVAQKAYDELFTSRALYFLRLVYSLLLKHPLKSYLLHKVKTKNLLDLMYRDAKDVHYGPSPVRSWGSVDYLERKSGLVTNFTKSVNEQCTVHTMSKRREPIVFLMT